LFLFIKGNARNSYPFGGRKQLRAIHFHAQMLYLTHSLDHSNISIAQLLYILTSVNLF